MPRLKSKAPKTPVHESSKVIAGYSYVHISNAIHGVAPDPVDSMREKLRRFAEQENHTAPPDDFAPVVKYSYFVKLKEFYEDTGTPEVKGRRMLQVRCVCGNIRTYTYRTVMAKIKTSCGCKEKTTLRRLGDYRAVRSVPPPNVQDLTKSGPSGDGVHGLLKVLSYKYNRGRHCWIVECACGWRKMMSRDTFRRKQTDTCGEPRCITLLGQGYTYTSAKRLFPKRRVEDVINNHNI